MSRLENLPTKTTLIRMMDAMVELFCDSFGFGPTKVPKPPRHFGQTFEPLVRRPVGELPKQALPIHLDCPNPGYQTFVFQTNRLSVKAICP
jgi:hypothetical protein